jgi:hypothetical protein
MGDLPGLEQLGEHPHHLAPLGEHRVRQGAHEAHARAPIDEGESPPSQLRAQLARSGEVLRPGSHSRATEDADGLDVHERGAS